MGRRTMRRATAAVALVMGVGVGTLAVGLPSAGAATVPIDYTVHASTTLAKLHQTVTVPPGTFTGKLDPATGRLRGTLMLPPASTTVALAGVGLVTATFSLVETRPVVGTVDLAALTVTARSSFNVDIDSVDPLGLPVNLVGNSCTTSSPVTVTFAGAFSLTGATSLSGDYTIPPLTGCGLLTPALNLLIPGPGNTFTAAFSPAAGG